MTADSVRTPAQSPGTPGAPADPLVRSLPVAGGVYVLAWALGLLLGPSAPGPTASATEIQAFYVDQPGGVVLQSLLVHGLAGIALVGLALGFARALPSWPLEARWIRGTGLAAALVSFLQVALALTAVAIADSAAASTSKALFSAVDYADTVKLILLASFAVTVTWAGTRAGALPTWVRGLGYLLVPLLILGGLAFVIDSSALYMILVVSLFALLAWAAATSWTLGRPQTP
jgi:hypothetical protein